MVCTKVSVDEKLLKICYVTYLGHNIPEDEWDNRSPCGPHITLGKEYEVLSEHKKSGIIEIVDDFGFRTLLPNLYFQ